MKDIYKIIQRIVSFTTPLPCIILSLFFFFYNNALFPFLIPKIPYLLTEPLLIYSLFKTSENFFQIEKK